MKFINTVLLLNDCCKILLETMLNVFRLHVLISGFNSSDFLSFNKSKIRILRRKTDKNKIFVIAPEHPRVYC